MMQLSTDKFVAKFLDSKRLKARKTWLFYELALRLYKQEYPLWPPSEESIMEFLGEVHDRCGPYTVHAYYRALRAFCNWAEKRGYLTENPVKLIDPPRLPKLLPRAPEFSDIKRLFDGFKDKWQDLRDKAILAIALDTGLRISEIANLEPADICLHEFSILVRQTKSQKQRKVVFSNLTKELVNEWIACRETLNHGLKVLFVSFHKGQWVSYTNWGMRLMLKRRCRNCGIRRFRFHNLRHAYAIYALRAGADILDVRIQLGHASLTSTLPYLEVADSGRASRHQKHSPTQGL